MLELMQKCLCNIFLTKLGPFDFNFIFQGLWLSILVKLNVTGFGKVFKKLKHLGLILA